jgi:quercetin dioxygenase-like cupin family protein
VRGYGEAMRLRAPVLIPLLVLVLALGGCAAGDVATPAPTPTAASATSAPVTAEDLSEGDLLGAVDIEFAGPVQVNHRLITIEPGAGTGLHCHYGNLIAVVESGELTHYAPIYATGVHVYRAGGALIEGAGYVHEGKNEGTVDTVLDVTYVTPEGDPLAETDLAKCSG